MISMHILHSVSGLILITVSLGHSYMGSFGVEGALDGMVTGEVDTAWAKQHHDLWYAEQMGEEAPAKGKKSAQSSTTGPAGLSTGKVSAS
jgi:formate dehydrogenase subunit gamma